MTLRNSFRRRPPFPFSQRARADQLVCLPRSYVRAHNQAGRALWAPMLAWSVGPQAIATVGDGNFNTLFGRDWLFQICHDGSWVLYQVQPDDSLQLVEWDAVPPVVSESARHLTGAFDQGARAAIAWEDLDGIHLREFNETTGQYHFIGPYAGVDPVLVMDAVVNRHIPGSDVVLWFLSADRLTLRYRIQSENFATAHDHHSFADPMVLDASDTGAYRLQLRVSDEMGGIVPEGSTFLALVSDLFPVYAGDSVSVLAEARLGEYERAAWSYQQAESLGVVSAALEGEYRSSALHASTVDALEAAAAALEGEYVAAVLRFEAAESLDVESTALEGEYVKVAIAYAAGEEPLVVTAAALEGAYGLP